MFFSPAELEMLGHSIDQFGNYLEKMPAGKRSASFQKLNSLRKRVGDKKVTKEDLPLLTYVVGLRSKLVDTAMQITELSRLNGYAWSLRQLHERLEDEARLAGVELQEPDIAGLSSRLEL